MLLLVLTCIQIFYVNAKTLDIKRALWYILVLFLILDYDLRLRMCQ
jgi:hypothetical protein